MGMGADHPADQIGWLSRWRDFVEAGLHAAAATDAPWFSPFSPTPPSQRASAGLWTR